MRGTYTIIVESKSNGYRTFGRLGRASLQKGRYLYTGSALGSGSMSLERRLQRHRVRSKKMRWHIDYLTTSPRCRVNGAVYVVSDKRLECDANLTIAKELKLGPLLPRIGASDCDCEGHLLGPELSLSKAALMKRLTNAYCRLVRVDPASPQVVQIDCASSHRFWNASRKILIKP
jgi:Uri superfamily endonuclease